MAAFGGPVSVFVNMVRSFLLASALLAVSFAGAQELKPGIIQLVKTPPLKLKFMPLSPTQKLGLIGKWSGKLPSLTQISKPLSATFDARNCYSPGLDAGIGGSGLGWNGVTNCILMPNFANNYVSFEVLGQNLDPAKTYLVLVNLNVLIAGKVQVGNGQQYLIWPLTPGAQTISILLTPGDKKRAGTITNLTQNGGALAWIQDATLEVVGA